MRHSTLKLTLALGFIALVTAFQANAVVVLGFEINSISSLPLFTHTAGDTNTITDDTLTANANVDLTVTLDGVPIPDSDGFQSALFDYSADLVSVSQEDNYLIMTYAGSFSFTSDQNETIVSGDFDDMKLVFLAPGGNILFPLGLTAGTTGDPLLFDIGEAMEDHLPDNMILKGAQSVSFTVDLFNNFDFIEESEGALIPVEDATFSSSFSATSPTFNKGDIPEPATISVALLGLMLMLKRNRNA